LDLLFKAAELDPRSKVIGASLTRAYFMQGLFSQGEQQAQQQIQRSPDFPISRFVLLRHYFQDVGEYAKALEQARALSRIDPEDVDTLGYQIEIYASVGDFQSAAEVQERIAKLDPDIFMAKWADLVQAIAENNASAMREAGNWMLQHAQGREWLSSDIGWVMLKAGDVDRARALLLEAEPGWLNREQWPQLIKSYRQKACVMSWILLNTGEPELGQALLDETSEFLDHQLPAAIEHADRYAPDTCYLVEGDTEKALASLETQLAHGHFHSWKSDHLFPMYRKIEQEPRYRKLLSERDLKVAEQRELIEKLKF